MATQDEKLKTVDNEASKVCVIKFTPSSSEYKVLSEDKKRIHAIDLKMLLLSGTVC